MAKTKQQENNVSQSEKEQLKSEKHKLSDTRWRTNIAQSFESLKSAISVDVGKENEVSAPRSRPMSRICILEKTLDYVQQMEEKVKCLLHLEARRNGYSDLDCLRPEFSLDFYRQAFAAMESEYAQPSSSSSGSSEKLEESELVKRQNLRVFDTLLKLKENESLEEDCDPCILSVQGTEYTESEDSQLSDHTNYTTLYVPLVSFPTVPQFTMQYGLQPESPCLPLGPPSLFPSAISNDSILMPLPTNSASHFSYTPESDMHRTRFAPPRLSDRVRRKLDMEVHGGKSSFVEMFYNSASGDGPCSVAILPTIPTAKHDEGCIKQEPSTPKGDVMQLSDDLKEINLCDFGLNNVNVETVYDFDAEEDFAFQSGETCKMEVSSGDASSHTTTSEKSEDSCSIAQADHDRMMSDFLSKNKIFSLNPEFDPLQSKAAIGRFPPSIKRGQETNFGAKIAPQKLESPKVATHDGCAS